MKLRIPATGLKQWILRLLPLLILLLALWTVTSSLSNLQHYAKGVATQYELDVFAQQIAKSHRMPDSDEFDTYLKTHFKVGQLRGFPHRMDASSDFWFSLYRLETQGKRFRVVSAGPDQRFGTSDDLYSEGQI